MEKNRGLTCMDPEEILVGGAVIGHAGSILCTRTSNENNFFGGNTSFHVCRNFHMLALVFSSTYLRKIKISIMLFYNRKGCNSFDLFF